MCLNGNVKIMKTIRLRLNISAVLDLLREIKLEIRTIMKTIKEIIDVSVSSKKKVKDFENVLRTDNLPYHNQTKQSERKARKGEWFQLFLDFSSKKNQNDVWENRMNE